MGFASHAVASGNTRTFSAFFDRWFPTPHFLEPSTVGVDVSDVSVKWVALDALKHVRSFGTVPLPPGVVVGGVIKDIDALVEALGALRQQGIIEAHAALPEETAYVFTMLVPDDTTREQTLRMVEFEFEGRVPVSPKASVYDFDVVPGRNGGNMREVGVVVFPHELAENYATAFSQAGIRLLSMELEARSIARAVSSSPSVPEESIALLVDFGRLRSGVAVLKYGSRVFTATVEVGGEGMERGLTEKLSHTKEDAEQFRNDLGLLADAVTHQKEIEVVAATAAALADEVSRYYHFWDTHKNDRGERATPVSRIILVGGSSNLNGLEEYIATRVQVPVVRGDVWHNIFSYDDYIPPISQRMSLGYATSVGLAMRGLSRP